MQPLVLRLLLFETLSRDELLGRRQIGDLKKMLAHPHALKSVGRSGLVVLETLGQVICEGCARVRPLCAVLQRDMQPQDASTAVIG
jgi:hypothetical protein